MIKTFYQEDIINRLAAIITYGLNEGYSYKSIEEHLISSSFVNDLEKNKYDIESKIEKVVESTYMVSLNVEADISFIGLFLAESYFKLFIFYHKSFEYIFLYWPLSSFIERYNVYHEMDFSNLRRDFESKIKQTTLLRKLALERQIKLVEISKLTGINENTIDKYSRDDKNLYSASYENIYKLATLFDVKENIFLSSLAVYLDQSIYLFDETNKDFRNYLGLLFAKYFDSRINGLDFKYDADNNCFKSSSGIKLIVIADVIDNLSIMKLNESLDSKTYLVIIPSGFIGDISKFEYMKSIRSLDVFILTQDSIYIVKKNIKKEITETINRSIIIRAKEASK